MKTILRLLILKSGCIALILLLAQASHGQWRNSCGGIFRVDEMAQAWIKASGSEQLPLTRFFYREPNTLGRPNFNKTVSIQVDPQQPLGKQQVDIAEIRFSQATASNNYSEAQYTVVSNAQLFLQGRLQVRDLPPITVFRDTQGRIWTLDHRRLAALRLANYRGPIEVEFASQASVSRQSYKMSTLDEGRSMLLKINKDLSAVIE